MEDGLGRKQFLLGVLLAWSPLVPTLIGLGYALRGVSASKATGIGAIAGGGLSGTFVLCGIGAILIGEVVAIVSLFRTFSNGHWVRRLFSTLSICVSALMLLLVCLFLGLLGFLVHHRF
ncbi:MAG: hypothetical protein WB919_14650 [Candidatus Sulfotelmatobacter sp.]